MIASKPQSAYAARKAGDWDVITSEVAALPSLGALEAWWTAFQVERLANYLPWQQSLLDLLDDRRSELRTEALGRSLDSAFSRAMERD